MPVADRGLPLHDSHAGLYSHSRQLPDWAASLHPESAAQQDLRLRAGKHQGQRPAAGRSPAWRRSARGRRLWAPHGWTFMLGAATSHRYNLTFSVNARNVLNRVNLATPIGNLNSPLFGESNALAGGPFSSASANRKLELQAAFSF